ncbi:bifunctional 3'-5' exonuclease/DNA polymerase [Agromyces sp. MMS24-JH15]|uniref:bifunctional 3'-5' exonuclease/DNA polymerase n=1 Tax=Agromyces sp. MMS24-JH15 TaxID=3243765 RepID=UPI003747D010
MLAEASVDDLPALVREFDGGRPRWIWSDTRRWYPSLLQAGVRVERCHDLRLVGAVLADSESVGPARASAPDRPAWLPRGPAEAAAGLTVAVVPSSAASSAGGAPALFELSDHAAHPPQVQPGDAEPAHRARDGVASAREVAAEHDRQESLIARSSSPGALRLLLAAESAGALIGAELAAAGVPWDADVHDRVLEAELGPRPAAGRKPERMEVLAAQVRLALDAPRLNLDSQADLLRALRAAGIGVASTSRWELREHEHAAIDPLVAYRRMSRLLTANGWTWLGEWVHDGRFRPEYVPGGTATGRWATSGGGALQLPKQVRAAVSADPGWWLVVADAAQLEPRILAAMSGDRRMADAGRGRDVYRGIVDAGVVETRDQAKVAMLGAMYGATTGESGRLVPRLHRAFPAAMALVDRAAAVGERGGRVTTLLGRSSPLPPETWRAIQSRASEPDATPADERRARSSARDWGRFTRNFVVQGTAAEWALCWMAGLRTRLAAIEVGELARPAAASGAAFQCSPHIVYFLHDELIVHAPEGVVDDVVAAVREAAAEAGRMLFGSFPIEFPLDLAVVGSYAEADD